jgi:hypothetical protein
LQTEAEKLEVAEPEPLVKESATSHALDELDHYLMNKRGANGTPLAYLTREHVVPTGVGDYYATPSITAELIRRARHGDYKTIENANDSTKGTAHRNISSLRREGGGDSKKGGGKFKGKGKEGGALC